MSIRVPTSEIAKTLRIWLSVISQRRPDILRNLWTRRGEEYDGEKIQLARGQLADEIATRLATSKWEVHRPELPQDALWSEIERTNDSGQS